MFANLLYEETLASGQTLIHISTKHWLCVLKFLRENVSQAVGEYMSAGNTSPSVAQHPGKRVSGIRPSPWGRVAGLRGTWGWCGQRSVGGWVGGDGIGCSLCDHPRAAGSQLRTAHFLSPGRVPNVRLVTKAAISPAWDWIFLFSEDKSQLLGSSQL